MSLQGIEVCNGVLSGTHDENLKIIFYGHHWWS